MAIDILYDRDITCLYCGKTFKTKRIRNSKLIVKKRDPDFCVHYEGENPYYYNISVCPYCSYAFSGSFSPVREQYKAALEEDYFQKVGSVELCGERTHQEAVRSYKLALVCGSIVHEPRYVMAGIFLRLAWLHRFQGDTAEEKKALAKALKLYNLVYEHGEHDKYSMGEHRLIYLLGELNGRLDKIDEARRWFNMVISDRSVEPALKNTARERWNEYKNKGQ